MPVPVLITSPNDPIIQMVRDYNILLSDKNTFSNAKIQAYLNQHAFPRIRGYLLTARSQSSGESGRMLFYNDITELSDPNVQAVADQKVIAVMTDSVVKDMIYMIAARLAASWCTSMIAGQITEQQKVANDLQKEAMADLKQLVSSPELTAAAAEVAAKTAASAADKSIAKIFMALAPDPNTYNPIKQSVQTYPGAQETGIARLWVNQGAIQADVSIGDTPAVIMNKLLIKLRENQGTSLPLNLVVAPNEGALTSANASFKIKDVAGNETEAMATLKTNMGWMTFHSSKYDLLVSAVSCTLELKNSFNKPGIKGILYGVMDTVQELATPSYSALTEKGPYSVLLDFSYGGAGTSAVLKDATKVSVAYDSLFFKINSPSTLISQDGLFKYRIGNLSAGTEVTEKFVVPRGSSLLDFIQLFAAELVKLAKKTMLLPAARSSADISTASTVEEASGVQLVPYEFSISNTKIVFDVLQAPPELLFATVSSSTLTANSAFDNQPKSLVLDIKYYFPGGRAALVSMNEVGEGGKAKAKPPIISNRLAQAFQDINYFNRGIF